MSRARPVARLLFVDGFRAAPIWMWATLLLTIVHGLAQAMLPLAFKLFIDATIGGEQAEIIVAAGISAALIAGFWFAATLDANLGLGLIDRMEVFVSARIAERVNNAPGIEHLEYPKYLEQLELLDDNRYLLRAAPRQTLTALSSFIRALTMAALLASVQPVLAALPLLWLAPAWAQVRSARVRDEAEGRVAQQRWLANELLTLTASGPPAKEVRVFGMGAELARRHDAIAARVSRVIVQAALRGAVVSAAGWALFVGGFVAGISVVVINAVEGRATPGEVVLVVVLTQQARRLLAQSASDFGTLATTARTASRLLWLEEYATAAAPPGSAQPPTQLRDGVRFDGVAFRYPGTTTDVLRGVDLTLPAGSTVAVIGDNGAGKTTLVKLLTGMYAPTEGCITVDGVDLATIDPAAWRGRIAAAYQDAVAFELVAAEVVGVGDLPRLDDHGAIEVALDRAHADDVVTALDGGLGSQLGPSFPDGRQLSGGQWQKLALARAMMRDEPLLLLLDEPTASLDAETEYMLFERYISAARRSSAASGAITLLVSHRFSTVRSAEIIIVVSQGSVLEVGSHDELVAAGGTYAELFALQARAYS